MSRVGFLRRGFILAVLKDAGTMPEVREELMRAVRNGRRSLEMAWRREEGIGSRGQVAWLDLDKLGKNIGGDGWREDDGSGKS